MCSARLALISLAMVSAVGGRAAPESTATRPSTSADSPPPQAPAEETKLLVTMATGTAPITTRRAVDASLIAALQRSERLVVITADDVKRRLDLEGERHRLGCDVDLTACMAEVRGALGVPLVLFVSADLAGDDALVSLTILDDAGRAVARTLATTPADGSQVVGDLRAPVAHLTRDLGRELGWFVEGRGPSLLAGSSGVLFVVGAATLAAGLMPLLGHQQAAAGLRDLRAASEAGDHDVDSATSAGADFQVRQSAAAESWDTWGLPLTVVGGVVLFTGLGLLTTAGLGVGSME